MSGISLNLLRAFYDEGLVDNRTFLVWLVQQLATCNLAQLGFIARLVNEYLDGMLVTRSITRPFVDVCLGKVSEVSYHNRSVVCGFSLLTLVSRPDYYGSVQAHLAKYRFYPEDIVEGQFQRIRV